MAQPIPELLPVTTTCSPRIASRSRTSLDTNVAVGDDLLGACHVVALETDEVELVIQVNGKLRGHLRAPRAADKAAIESLALSSEIVLKHTNGTPPKKVVVVPGRLVNVVV